MKVYVYLVIGYHNGSLDRKGDAQERTSIFGAFSTEERANEIAGEMRENFKDHHEEITIEVSELSLDEPTELYKFFKDN